MASYPNMWHPLPILAAPRSIEAPDVLVAMIGATSMGIGVPPVAIIFRILWSCWGSGC